MSQNGRFVLGPVTERKPGGRTIPSKSINPGSHGFPIAQHRSKSAFARSRQETQMPIFGDKESRPHAPPIVISTPATVAEDVKSGQDDWMEQISAENEMRVASMTDEEREAEKREILERFGSGIGDVLKRARLARERNATKSLSPSQKHRPPPPSEADTEAFEEMPEVPISEEEPAPSRPSGRGFSPPPALSRPHSRPSSRADRKLRFAELGPSDVFVYESAPPSPKKRPLALPFAENDGTAVSLGQWRGKIAPMALPSPQPSLQPLQPQESEPTLADTDSINIKEPEEGTSEYIRRRYFPDAPPYDPNLAWMQDNPLSQSSTQAPASLRFDLYGSVIPLSKATELPTHLGLHHHAEGLTAGYTLDDIFLLSRSTVPAQRATMLGVLARIAIKLSLAVRGRLSGLEDLVPRAEEVRTRIMAAGAQAMNEKGSVGARAIEVIWLSLVGWEETSVDGIELQRESDTTILSLQLDFFLPQVAIALSQGDLPPESSTQLLAILHRLGQQSNGIAETIVKTPNLLSNVLQVFLQMPISAHEGCRLPEPAALQFFITLASASRANAEFLRRLVTPNLEGLTKPPDTLLRFITILPPSSPFPLVLATDLLALSLRFYCVLAFYGLCSGVSKVIVEQFARLSQYTISSPYASHALKLTWLDLLGAWTACAINPHKTTPVHDILWNEVAGWLWKDDVARLVQGLDDQKENWLIWGAVFRVEAQWLEGCQVNGIRGGEAERLEFLQRSGSGFSDGTRGRVILGAIDTLRKNIDTTVEDLEGAAVSAGLLSAAIRLWLACLPPHQDEPSNSPPFKLPFPAVSAICAKLVSHPLWDSIVFDKTKPSNLIHARQLSNLLASYLTLSRKLPDISEELWVAQALSILPRLMPGDEEFATSVVERLLGLFTSKWVSERGVVSPTAIWDRGGLGILQPFLSHTIKPNKNNCIAPVQITPESIATCLTLRLPMASRWKDFGLPLSLDWTLSPINHLLRSGDSEVFKQLPSGWDSSELEITRATLFLSNLSLNILTRSSLNTFYISQEEAAFGCMKVFMLEHGQPDHDSAEVFRDSVVERLMGQILEPYYYGKASAQGMRPTPTLEQIAIKFLGNSTPFFQFYTDFVGLYDAISFSEPTFAKLLLVPISMRYAVDYRRYLWDDFNHIIKTIRTPCEEVLSSDLRGYLYPLETDPQLIGAFLRTLLKQPLHGFVRLVAVHHIASNIWSDLQEEGSSNETRAEKLIKAIVAHGSNDAVREVVTYRQTSTGSIWVPPACFEHTSEVAAARLAWIRALGDGAVISHVEGLLI